MAFNPFHSVRQDSKVRFGGLTVVCMFTFVLSSGLGGGGDFFDQARAWFGGRSHKGNVIATMYGDKVYDPEVANVMQQRRIANFFVSAAVERTHARFLEQIEAEVPKFDDNTREPIQRLLGQRR